MPINLTFKLNIKNINNLNDTNIPRNCVMRTTLKQSTFVMNFKND